VSVVQASDKFTVHATGWENAHVAAIDAAGFIRVESEEAAPAGRGAGGPCPISDEAVNRARRRKKLPKA
jgi:hypothetical protein